MVLPLTGEFRSFPADHYVFMATSMGTVKKTTLDEFNNPRKLGIIAVDLDAGDFLIGAALTDGKHDVMLFSDGGKAVRFAEDEVRPLSRTARGVRGMMLEEGQSVIAMLVAEDETQSVLTATENGYGKRTSIVEYTRHGRGTKGMIAIQQTERNGRVVAATLVRPADEIMLITDKGVLVRTRVSEIRELGRATQGVTLIALDNGSKLSGLQRIVDNDRRPTSKTTIKAPATAPRKELDVQENLAWPCSQRDSGASPGSRCRAGHGAASPAKKELVAAWCSSAACIEVSAPARRTAGHAAATGCRRAAAGAADAARPARDLEADLRSTRKMCRCPERPWLLAPDGGPAAKRFTETTAPYRDLARMPSTHVPAPPRMQRPC